MLKGMMKCDAEKRGCIINVVVCNFVRFPAFFPTSSFFLAKKVILDRAVISRSLFHYSGESVSVNLSERQSFCTCNFIKSASFLFLFSVHLL